MSKQSPADEIEQLRELIRQAHEVMGDLKREMAAGRKMVADLVLGVVTEEVSAQIIGCQQTLTAKMDEAEHALAAEFKALREDYLLARKDELPTLEEMMISQKVIEFILKKARDDNVTGNSVISMTVMPASKVKEHTALRELDLKGLRLRSGEDPDIAQIKVRLPDSKDT